MNHKAMQPRFESRIIRTTPWNPDVNVAKTFALARKKGPLCGGPVKVVKVEPFGLMHPDHPRHIRPATQIASMQALAPDTSVATPNPGTPPDERKSY